LKDFCLDNELQLRNDRRGSNTQCLMEISLRAF